MRIRKSSQGGDAGAGLDFSISKHKHQEFMTEMRDKEFSAQKKSVRDETISM